MQDIRLEANNRSYCESIQSSCVGDQMRESQMSVMKRGDDEESKVLNETSEIENFTI